MRPHFLAKVLPKGQGWGFRAKVADDTDFRKSGQKVSFFHESAAKIGTYTACSSPKVVNEHFRARARAPGPDFDSKFAEMTKMAPLACHLWPESPSSALQTVRYVLMLTQNRSKTVIFMTKTAQKCMPQRHHLSKVPFLSFLPLFSQKWARK